MGELKMEKTNKRARYFAGLFSFREFKEGKGIKLERKI